MTSPMGSSALPSPDPMRQDLSWLNTLSSQPIFQSGSQQQQSSTLVLRGTDVIALADRQLRMMNLSSLKNNDPGNGGGGGGAGGSGLSLGSYKVLSNPLIDETLRSSSKVSLGLNPSKTLLVIHLPSTLLLVILPRSTSISSNSTAISPISVKAHKIGSFYHNSHCPRAEQVVSTKWHPWSKRSTSLLVLLRNGTLFEYDVARDTKEPQQSLQLLPNAKRKRLASPLVGLGGRSTSTSRSLRFDQEEQEDEEGEEELSAVNFTLGISDSGDEFSGDWLPLTIYTLTRSGDVYAAAPFLPKFAHVPTRYLHLLSSHIQDDQEGSTKQREYSLRFVSSLLKQAKAFQERRNEDALLPDHAQDTGPRARASTEEILNRRSRSVLSMSLDPPPADQPEQSEAQEQDSGSAQDDYVEAKAPMAPLIPGPIESQGPFLLAPAPHELNETRESQGSDLLYIRLPSSTSPSSAVDVLMLASEDGRVDVGLLSVSGKVSPKWTSKEQKEQHFFDKRLKQSQKQLNRSSNRRGGRYGLDDDDSSESEQDDDIVDEDSGSFLPTLFIYESIDLGFPNGASSLRPRPSMIQDGVYADTIYLHHAFGSHMICISNWAIELSEAIGEANEDGGEKLTRFLHSSKESQVKWIVRIQDAAEQTSEDVGRQGVVKVEVVDDIYLGYSLLILLGDGECFGVELSLRGSAAVEDTEGEAEGFCEDQGDKKQKPHYISLLGDDAFVLPKLFSSGGAGAGGGGIVFPSTRLKNTSASGSGKGEIQVNPESLRLLASTVQDLRHEMRQVISSGNTVQRRLELQLKELQRQLGKLSSMQNRIEAQEKQQGLKDRIARVTSRQKGLISKVDRILQLSMDSRTIKENNGGMSKYEISWLNEMNTLQHSAETDEEGVKKLQSQLQDLKPDFKLLLDLQEQKSHTGLGKKQLNAILDVLNNEATSLLEAKEKVSLLNRSVAKISSSLS
ncbi:unnamed protein product [Sympodiomycopsis kandeliae]